MKHYCIRLVFVIILANLSATALYAATVVGLLKKRSVAKIDEGSATGFVKGTKVCFFNDSDKKVACGRIRRAKENISYVRVRKKRFRFIKKGMQARIEGAILDAEGQQVATTGTDHRTNFKLAYIITPVAPATYNKLTYKAPESATASGLETLWKSEGASSSSFIGVAAEAEFGLFEDMAMSVGLRYRLYQDFLATSDYNTEDADKFVEIEQTATALGFYSDFTFLDVAFSPSFFWRTSSGLDFDQSTVSLSAIQQEDGVSETNTIVSAKSSLSVISLRLGSNFNYMVIEPAGLIFGINMLVPITTMGASYSGDVNDAQESMLSSGDATKDVEESLAHDKSGFGAEIVMAAYFAF